MLDTWPRLRATDFPALRRGTLTTLQVNLGYRCNQSCSHCHVNAGPRRTEQMSDEWIDLIPQVLTARHLRTLDLTGGAPELHPRFCHLVAAARGLGVRVIDRSNLTILSEPGMEDLAGFLAEHGVEVAASLPCYLEENVDRQRGDGVFQSSIAGLRRLNGLGYGREGSGLVLNLVYNPGGPALPPEQVGLEAAYKSELARRYGIAFNRLYTITNMPIRRFGSTLISQGRWEEYLGLLQGAFRPCNLGQVMCLDLVSVDWRGALYDCDFNQQLGLPLLGRDQGALYLRDLIATGIEGLPIQVAGHCYGCTAGGGSSCGGAFTGGNAPMR